VNQVGHKSMDGEG